MKKNFLTFVLFAAACSQVLYGCSKIEEQAKASPAAPSGYLDESKKMEKQERFPFNRVWVSPEWPQKRDSYTKIIIAPVNLDYLQKMGWWKEQTVKTQEDMKRDQAKIAAFMQQSFKDAIEKDPNHRLQVVTTPGPDTLTLEIALVELIPSKAFFNAAAAAGGWLVPGVGLLSAFGAGSVAIEGRVRDSKTGKVFVQMADREENKTAFVDVAAVTWYDGAKDAITDWSNQFVELANSPLTEKVSDSSPFTLIAY